MPAAPKNDASPTRSVQLRRMPAGHLEWDELAMEEPLSIRVESEPWMVTMRTPGQDLELTAGLLYTQGVIEDREDLLALRHLEPPGDPLRNTVDVRLAPGCRVPAPTRALFASSACGVCGEAGVSRSVAAQEPLTPQAALAAELLLPLPDRLRAAQDSFHRTGGIHAAGLFTLEGRLLHAREDIGRHNAVDKVLGCCLLRDELPCEEHILLCSGRLGFEILQKALAARIPHVAAVGAPSSLAVELARQGGIQLYGFLRGGRFNHYTAAPSESDRQRLPLGPLREGP